MSNDLQDRSHKGHTEEIRPEWIDRAIKWRAEHSSHVRKLEQGVCLMYPPSPEDQSRPELWKDGSWAWLRFHYENKEEVTCPICGNAVKRTESHGVRILAPHRDWLTGKKCTGSGKEAGR